MSTPVRVVPTVIVQSNTTLSDDDSTWITLQFARYERDTRGAGQIVGDAVFTQQFGLTTAVNQHDPVYAIGTNPNLNAAGPDDGLIGQLVRFLASDESGSITVGDVSYSAFWHGQITGYEIIPDGRPDTNAGGTAKWQCAGLLSILDQIVINGGWTVPPSADTVTFQDPGFCPPFNAVPTGDRSTAQYTVNGQQVYIHDLTTLTVVSPWQAVDIVNLLLAGAAQPVYAGSQPTGFPWALSDPQGALSYRVEKTDVNGRTLAEAINILIDPRRGLTYAVTVESGVATINVWPATDTAITIGAFTLPASTNTNSYTAAGNRFTRDMVINEDQSATYDIIEVRGARPWVGITHSYNTAGPCSLIKGWNPALETNWALDNYQGLAVYEQVWRLWLVDPQWDGAQYNDGANGMRNVLGTDNPGGGFDGSRSVDLTDDDNPSASLYGMEGNTPASTGFGQERVGPRQLPLVIFGDGTAGNWVDYSNPNQASGNVSFGIDCQDDPPSIRITDTSSGKEISDQINDVSDPGTMLVTVGMRETQPLKASYIFDQSTWPRSTPRIKMINVPDLEYWSILPGTVLGVDQDGNLSTASFEFIIRDDTITMNQLLALAVARYGYPIVTARWTEQCLLDFSGTLDPGVLLSNVILGTGNVYIGSVITRVTRTRVVRDGVDQFDTSYETTRVNADEECVL